MPRELWHYQDVGSRWLAQRPRAGLLDKPRVGKTAQVIRGMDLLGHARGWVVVPAVARENWLREFRNFELQRRRVCKGTSIHDFIAWAHGHYDVLVPSYEMAVRWAPFLHDRCEPLQFMHFDEAHLMKSDGANRTKALLGPGADGDDGALQWAEYSWWITGTPAPNDPMDIFTFLRHQQVMPLGREGFRKRYFYSRAKTYGTAQTARPEMLGELRQLIGNNSICRTLADTAPDLPPMVASQYVVDGNGEEVRRLLLEHPGLDQQIKRALEEGNGLSGLEAPYIATLRRLIGEAKALPYAHAILGELQGGLDKVVIFGHHRSALAVVRDHLTKNNMRGGMITGDTSEREKTAVQDAFASDPEYRFVLANIRAAGVAINLTASAALDMLESDWAPWMNYQALMRVYGQTQKRTVRVRFITLANTFDETVNEIIADKTRACGDLDISPEPDMEGMLR
jgi:SWI/SNF-related matrix-associated actin-dependent regulator of chromatin subfamily A-like protein 1